MAALFLSRADYPEDIYRFLKNVYEGRFQIGPITQETRDFVSKMQELGSPYFDIWQQAAAKCVERNIVKKPEQVFEHIVLLCTPMKERVTDPGEYVVEKFLEFSVALIEARRTQVA